jgi:hypothetical protein
MYNDLSKSHIFENVKLGFEFEFFSPIDRAQLAKIFEESLGRSVLPSNQYKSSIQVTESQFKLEADFSGGFKMHELVTAPLPYSEAVNVLFRAMNIIAENGFTTDRCGLHINLSIDEKLAGLNTPIENLNTLKFILNLDESLIYGLWPNALNKTQKPYKGSVNFIYPKNKFIAETSLSYKPDPTQFKIPQSKYFGLNFSKLVEGYLEIRYAGGKDYQAKKSEAVQLINYLTELVHETLSKNSEYSLNEKQQIAKILEKQKAILLSLKSPQSFRTAHPNINLFVDLHADMQIIEANFANLKDQLFDLIAFGNVKSGVVNYDTQTRRIQLKDSKIKEGFGIEGLDLFNCIIEGEVSNSMLYGCKVKSSLIKDSLIYTNNEIRHSLLKGCSFQRDGVNLIAGSYLDIKPEHPIFAELRECIVRSGTLSYNSIADSKTEFITDSGTSINAKS